MKILVCGGRDYNKRAFLYEVLNNYWVEHGAAIRIINGGASGADAHARAWASFKGVPCTTVSADWDVHGRAAGPIRNQRMLDEEKPDLVIAFPGQNGTADMIRRARKAGVPVEVIS